MLKISKFKLNLLFKSLKDKTLQTQTQTHFYPTLLQQLTSETLFTREYLIMLYQFNLLN